MSKKPNIIICIPIVWSIRNFILNGLNKELEQKYTIYYAVPPVGANSLSKYGISNEKILILETTGRTKLYRFLDTIIKLAHKKRNPTKSDKIFKLWQSRDQKISLKHRLINLLYNLLSVVAYPSLIFKALQKLSYKELDKTISKEMQAQANSINPEFILSTALVVNWEWNILRAAKLAGAKVYSFILSFDNLTSRGYIPLSYFDKFMVWNKTMKLELTKYFNISENKITIVDTPQFDYHLNNTYLKPKEEILKQLGYKLDDNYLVYCANHINLTPGEPQLVDEILDAIRNDATIKNYRVVLRLHPMDDYDRWNPIIEKYPFVTLNLPWTHDDKQAIYWGNPSLEEVVFFSNILRYADSVLNIASTVSIDASMVNSPVICVGYHPDKGSIEDKTYYGYHFTEHYKPIIDTGAVTLARDKDEVISLIKETHKNPNRTEAGRKKLNSTLLNHLDGKSKERILAAING